MILFIGEQSKGYFIEDCTDEEITYSGYSSSILGLKNLCLKDKYTAIIFDVEQFIDNYKVIADEVEIIKNVSNSNIIIFAEGYSIKSEIVQALVSKGITNFILAPLLTNKKQQFIASLNNKNNIIDAIASQTALQTQEQGSTVHKHSNTPYTTIAVAGCCSRIGTTTQAIQLVKYLISQGYKACYVEMNNTGFVDNVLRSYEVTKYDDNIGKLTYMGIDMFNKKENISEILQLGYDYFVYDNGSFDSASFNSISFFEKNFCVAVCGSKPCELNKTEQLIARTYKSDCFYLFSFCHENEQKDVLELMQEKKNKTGFTYYTPDYFTYSSDTHDLYKKIVFVDRKTVKKKNKIFAFSR